MLLQVAAFHPASRRNALDLRLLFRLRRKGRHLHHWTLQFSYSRRRGFDRLLAPWGRCRDWGLYLPRRSDRRSSLLYLVWSTCQRGREKISRALEAGYFII
jgi:hypothetical protein